MCLFRDLPYQEALSCSLSCSLFLFRRRLNSGRTTNFRRAIDVSNSSHALISLTSQLRCSLFQAYNNNILKMKDEMDMEPAKLTFPFKLYHTLEWVSTSEFSSALSWSASGDAFVVHDREVIVENIIPLFFDHKKWRSFVSSEALLY